jgi:hypothetical protein
MGERVDGTWLSYLPYLVVASSTRQRPMVSMDFVPPLPGS